MDKGMIIIQKLDVHLSNQYSYGLRIIDVTESLNNLVYLLHDTIVTFSWCIYYIICDCSYLMQPPNVKSVSENPPPLLLLLFISY